jgi:hypothetical protein
MPGNEFCMESRGEDVRREKYPARIHRSHTAARDCEANTVIRSQHYFILNRGFPPLRVHRQNFLSERQAVRYSSNYASYHSKKLFNGSYTQYRRGILKNEPQEQAASNTDAIREFQTSQCLNVSAHEWHRCKTLPRLSSRKEDSRKMPI